VRTDPNDQGELRADSVRELNFRPRRGAKRGFRALHSPKNELEAKFELNFITLERPNFHQRNCAPAKSTRGGVGH
jgi:hypothetical protein